MALSVGLQGAQLGPHKLAQAVDRQGLALALDIPEGPAVTGGCPLCQGPHRVDRAAVLGRDQAAIGPHPRLMPAGLGAQDFARTDEAPLDEVAERDARGLAL